MLAEYIFMIVPAAVFILGLITGGLSNVTSGGAGVLTIYVLTAYGGANAHIAFATVLASSTVFVAIGAISFYRKKQVNTQLALTVGISGVIGAYLGARWALTLNSGTLEQGFGAFTLVLVFYTSYLFYGDWKKKKKTNALNARRIMGGSDGPATPTVDIQPKPMRFSGRDPASLTVQIAKGVLIGFVTGIFGVSLASLSVVLFIILFRLDTKMVLGTSLFASFLRYAGGTVAYLGTGEINLTYFLLLAIGGTVGSIFGARMILKDKQGSNEIYVKIIIILMLIFISYEFLLKYYIHIPISI